MTSDRVGLKEKKIHFVGIGGAGMSALAQICISMGNEVRGSDIKESRNTQLLRNQGAQIFIGHAAENARTADILVYSSAVPRNNCELEAAREHRIPQFSRGEMLAFLSEGKKAIGVAGTHGKTTTTSMISLVLEKSGLNPTFVIGGELNDIGTSARYGNGDFFVAETDESDGSFLHLKPDIAVITNIEYDHMDFYESLSVLERSFVKFVEGVKEDGSVIVCGDFQNIRPLTEGNHRRYLSYGLGRHNHFCADQITLDKFEASFSVYRERTRIGKVCLGVPGMHNVSNALAATVLGLDVGISFDSVCRALKEFSGVKRRFERVGTFAGVTVVNDYAHHPTEVKAVLRAAKVGGWKRIVCLFQPHRFSRTKHLHAEFGAAFSDADVVIITDVYGAGEEPVPGISGKLIEEGIQKRDSRKQVTYVPHLSDIWPHLASVLEDGDLLLLVGAGDVGSLAEKFPVFLKEPGTKVDAS